MNMDKISMVVILLCALQVWKIEGKLKLKFYFIIYQPLQLLYILTSVHLRCIVEQKFSQFYLYSPK